MSIDVRDPNSTFSYGMALEDFGLCQVEAINGFGLVTRGFLWQAYGIWANVENTIGISTSWTVYASGSSNSWAVENSSVVTTWTLDVSALFGELPPQIRP